MAARSLGSLTVDLILKASGFAEGWTAAERDADKAQRKMSAKAKQSAKEVSDAWNGAASLIGSTFAGISVGMVFSEMVGIAKQTSEAAAEVERFSQLANTSTRDFQRLAAGANTVGVSAEKMADIFKDVQDKVGDFIQTGGGGMADFFERVAPKVGVTAEQFRKLSGPDALQLYVSSLEKANLSQSDMVFFMEALASDSSNLIPLLKDQGAAWQELGDRAEAYGAILGTDALEAAKAYKAESDNLSLALKGLQNEIASGLLPSLTELNSNLASPEVQSGIRETIGLLADMASGVVNLGTEFFLGMQYADGFWDALFKYGLTNPFKDAETQLADLGKELEKEQGRAEKFSLFWTEAQQKASLERQRDLQQQIGYYTELGRLANQRATREINAQSREGLPSYESLGGLPEPIKLSAAFKKATPKASGGKSQADKDREAAEKYVLALREQAEAVKALSATEKLAYDLSEKKIKLTATQTAQARTYAEAIEQQVARQKAAVEFEKEMARVTAESDRNEQLREEIVLIGKSEDQLYEIQRLRVEETLLVKQQHAAELDRLNTTDAGWSRQRANLESEIQLLEERLGLMDSGRTRQKSADSWKAQQEQGQKAMDSIVQSFTDGLMNGTQSFAQLLKNTVFTVAVRPAVEQGIRSALGMEQPAGSAGGGMGAGNPFSDWSTWGPKAGDFLSDTGFKAIGEGFTDVGVGLNNLGSTIQGWDATIKGVPGLEGGFGSVFGYGQALMSLSEGNYAGAIGTAIGTYILPGIGTVIGSTLGGFVDDLFGGGRPTSRRLGGAFSTTGADDRTVSASLALTDDFKKAVENRSNESLDSAVMQLTTSVTGLYNALAPVTGAGRLGGTAAFADEPSLDDRYSWAAFKLFDELTGEVLAQWNSGKALDADGEKAFLTLSNEMSAAVVTQLKSADIPGWMRSMLDGMGEVTIDGLAAVVQQVAQIEAAFRSLGKVLPAFANITDAVETALINGLGGIQGVTAATSAYYENFYSEAERMETLAAQLQSAVGIDPRLGDVAKEQFKKAVETALQGGDGALAAALLSVNAEFAKTAEYGQKAMEAVTRAAYDAALAARDAGIFWADLRLETAETGASNAMRQLEASISRDRALQVQIIENAQENLGALNSSLSLLVDTARDLRGEVQENQQWQAAAGMVYLENALAAVQSGASVLEFTKLSDSIDAARRGLAVGNYSTQFERDRDTLVLAGQLGQLGDLTGEQLTSEEKTLKAAQKQVEQLDATLAYWQQALQMDQFQIDATMGVAVAVLAMDAAIRELAAAQAASRAANQNWGQAIVAATPLTEADKADLYMQMAGSGLTDTQIRNQVYKATGNYQTETDWEYLKRLVGLPSYAVGTPYVPEDGLAMIHEGEMIVPKAFNPNAGSASSAVSALQSDARMQNAATLISLNQILRIVRNWDADGLPLPREEEAV